MAPSDASPGTLVPLYRQVSERLAKSIVSGELAEGQALPTEFALCAQFGVSRITVRKALDELVDRQLVIRRRGVGNFVSEDRQSTWSVTLTGVIEDVLTPSRLTIVSEKIAAPPADVLRFARLPPRTRMKLFEAANHIEGVPLVHVRYHFPLAIAERLSAEALSGPLQAIKVVEQATGRQVDHAEQLVLPFNARGTIARSLGVSPGTAVLRAIRVYWDTAQQPMEIFDACYHPTEYRYTATLYPRRGAPDSR
jgi:DNA-binding GntR family transcriptional regulator